MSGSSNVDGDGVKTEFGRGLICSSFSQHNVKVVALSIRNHLEYAAKWNCSLVFSNEGYSKYIDWGYISCLLRGYDFVACVGTDILFTDFSRDIRGFIGGPLTIQRENRLSVNGDFIVFSRPDLLSGIGPMLSDRRFGNSTQDAVNYILGTERSNLVSVLPPRSLQSLSPYELEHMGEWRLGSRFSREEVESLVWRTGDFSVHLMHMMRANSVEEKESEMRRFIGEHPELFGHDRPDVPPFARK